MSYSVLRKEIPRSHLCVFHSLISLEIGCHFCICQLIPFSFFFFSFKKRQLTIGCFTHILQRINFFSFFYKVKLNLDMYVCESSSWILELQSFTCGVITAQRMYSTTNKNFNVIHVCPIISLTKTKIVII